MDSKILLAEDEAKIRQLVSSYLVREGFKVIEAADGQQAVDRFEDNEDVVLVMLDVMMPRKDGFDACREIREKSDVPILMLTAKAEIEDRVAGLEAGADDYLPKPFASREFIARVKALSRRNTGYAEQLLSFGDVKLDCNRYELICGKEKIRLNNKEFQLRELFMRHPHFVFSANHLMDRIWGQDSESDISVVWTYIGFIRKRLKQVNGGIEIRTVRGAGYSLEEAAC